MLARAPGRPRERAAMSQYDTTLDLTVSNTSHAQIIDLIGGNKTVLDVGCATGYLAQALRARGCTVSGVEYDAEAAEMARPHLDLLVVGDPVSYTPLRAHETRHDLVCRPVLEKQQR